MCREAVCEILNKSSSQPWFLREMFHKPEKVLRQFSLTNDEKKALITGNIGSIESYAGHTLTPLLKRQFESSMHFSTYRQAYLLKLERSELEGLEIAFGQEEVEMVGEPLR